jgi:RND family efflux transporter MFP subunit
MTSLEVEVDVNESYINRVKSGQDVTAVLDAYPDFEIPARVITTVPTADRQKATVLVRIAFKTLDPRILPDMGVKVTFLRDAGDSDAPATQPMSLVPRSAIQVEGDQAIVFLVRPDGTVERRAVRTGGIDGDRQEVVAGLRAGDRVVVAPPPALSDGARIIIKSERSVTWTHSFESTASTSTSPAAVSGSMYSRASVLRFPRGIFWR